MGNRGHRAGVPVEIGKPQTPTLVRLIAPFLLIAVLVGLVYAPVTQIPYAPAGDDQKLLWPESSHTCCKGAFDVPTWQFLGRGLGALIANAIFNPLFELEDLAVARRIGVLVAIVVSAFGFWTFRRAGAPEALAFVSAAGIALLPGATQGIVHAHAGTFLLFPMLLALPAGALVLEAVRRSPRGRAGFDITFFSSVLFSFGLLLGACWIYPAVATVFLVPATYALLFGPALIYPPLRTTLICFGVFLFATVSYFLIHQFYFLPSWLLENPRFANLTTGPRFELVSLLSGEIIFAKFITASNDLSRATVLWFAMAEPRISRWIVIAVVAAGVVAAAWNRRAQGPIDLAIRITAVLAFLLLSDIANLAAAVGTSGFRLIIAMQLILVGTLLWSLLQISSLLLPNRSALTVGIIGMVCVSMGAFAAQEQAVRGAANAAMMWTYIKSRIAEAVDKRIEVVHVIRPHRRPEGFPAFIGGMATEMVNTEPTPFIVAAALGELGYRYPFRFIYRDYESDALVVVGPNDVIIDMNAISPRPTPRYRDLKFYSSKMLRRDFGNMSPEALAAPFEDNDLPTPSVIAFHGPIGPDYRVVDAGAVDPLGHPTALSLSIARCGAKAPRIYAPPVVRRMAAGDKIEISAWVRRDRTGSGPVILGAVLEPGGVSVETAINDEGEGWRAIAAIIPLSSTVETYRPYLRFGSSAKEESCPARVDIWGLRAIGRGGYLAADRFGRPVPKIVHLVRPTEAGPAPYPYPLANLFDDSPSMTEMRIATPFDFVFLRDDAASLGRAFRGYSFLADADKGALDRLPTDWCIHASDDGVLWREIECRQAQAWQPGERRSFSLPVPVSDRFLKVSILKAGPSDLLRLSGLGLDYR